MRPLLRTLLKPAVRPVAVYSSEEESLRHATWLELFFDLVFIVAVAELGEQLWDDLTLAGLFKYASLFLIVWWAWLGFSYYADVFDTDDLLSRLAMIFVMFGVIILSQTIPEALDGGSLSFAAAFLLLRMSYLGLTFRAWYMFHAEAQKFLNYWLMFSTLATVVWALSLFNPEPARFGLWISAFLLEIAGIGIVYLVFDSIPVQVSHFPERLGLFTILVLGETIISVAVGTEAIDWFTWSGVVALGGFMIAVAVWWLYFSNFDERTINRALENSQKRWVKLRERMLVYVFGHYFIFIGIGIVGIGIEAAVEGVATGHGFSSAARIALAAGAAAFLFGSSICHRAMPTALHPHLFLARIGVGTFFTVVIVVAGIGPDIAIWFIALSLVGLIALEEAYLPDGSDSSPHESSMEAEP
jgi:low temperature requirement protein LtrA